MKLTVCNHAHYPLELILLQELVINYGKKLKVSFTFLGSELRLQNNRKL